MAERFGHPLHPGFHTERPDSAPVVDDQPAHDELGVRPHIVVDLDQQLIGIHCPSADRSRETSAHHGPQQEPIEPWKIFFSHPYPVSNSRNRLASER